MDGVPIYLKYRVLDPVSGAVLIDPLPHPHQSSYEVIFPQPGMPGRTGIGSVTIPLFNPGTDQYRWAKTDYDQLTYMARLEGYQQAGLSDAAGAPGKPVFSGVITALPKDLENYSIQGQDSLFLLQTKRTRRTETTGNTSTDTIFKNALKGYSLVYGDDFSSANLAANYTNDGTWTYGAPASNDFQPAYVAGGGGDGLLYTTTSFTNANYADCNIQAQFTTQTFNAAPSGLAPCAIIAAVADANNFVMGQCLIYQTATGVYRVDAYIYQKSGGTYSIKAQVQGIIPLNQSAARLQLNLIGFQTDATHYRWTLLVNEFDYGCTWLQTVAGGSPTGAIGLRSLIGGVSSSAIVWALKNVLFFNNVAMFQNGTITAGNGVPNQAVSLMTKMDVAQLAMTTEGFTYRKTPAAGLNNDVMDFAASPGTDLSASVKLEEGVNLSAAGTEPNAEPFGTGVIVAGSPGPDASGPMHWYSVAAIQKYGLVEDIAPLPNYVNGVQIRQAADAILKNRSTPDQAKRFDVIRTMDLIPSSPTTSTLVFREGDSVTVRVPRMSGADQKVKILTCKVTEGSPIVQCTGDQYPIVTDRLVPFDRLVETTKSLAAGVHQANPAMLDVNGVPTGAIMVRQGNLFNNPWKMRVYQTTAQNYVDNATQVVKYDTIDFDTSNSFSTTAWQFTAPITGYYWLSCAVGVNTVANANVIQMVIPKIYVNGASSKWGNTILYEQGGIGIGRQLQATIADTFLLNQSDTVQIQAYILTNGGVPTAATGSQYSYWSMHLISA